MFSLELITLNMLSEALAHKENIVGLDPSPVEQKASCLHTFKPDQLTSHYFKMIKLFEAASL